VKKHNGKNLYFTTNFSQAVASADVVIVTVGTPTQANGETNLTNFKSAIKEIAQYLTGYTVICTKSTVPIGTSLLVNEILNTHAPAHAHYDIVSNPEFMREGTALDDFLCKNPIVIGAHSEHAFTTMEGLYKPLIEKSLPYIKTTPVTAETIKYAWNSFLTVKVAYINELAQLCHETGANINKVIQSVGYGEMLRPFATLKPGPGIGGSCLPKDSRAFIRTAKNFNVNLSLIDAAMQSNTLHQQKIIHYIYQLLEDVVQNKKIAILGLAFKAGTDDIRDSVAIPIIHQLLHDGAKIKAYDPQAMQSMHKIFPTIEYTSSSYEAVQQADLVIVLTEWDEFIQLNLAKLKNNMHQAIALDTRNIWDPKKLKNLQFSFINLGRN